MCRRCAGRAISTSRLILRGRVCDAGPVGASPRSLPRSSTLLAVIQTSRLSAQRVAHSARCLRSRVAGTELVCPPRPEALPEAGEAAFTQRVIAVGIHATSILEAGLSRTAVQTPMRECVLVTRGVIPCRAVQEASVGNKLPQEADRSGHTACLPRADDDLTREDLDALLG